jgi:site-specific DNA-cytosine methylase
VLECVRRVNPHVKFILENVKMKKEYRDIISKHLGVEPIEIDSALLSAQSRKRLYWTNIPDVVQPEEKWVSFHSILESGCALSDKAYALTHSYYKKGGEGTRLRCLARSQRPVVIIDGNHSRWLTPIECERLQTVPDNYTNHVSNTQRYRMLGNGMTVDVIAHILSHMFGDEKADCGCPMEDVFGSWCDCCQTTTVYCNCSPYGTCMCS